MLCVTQDDPETVLLSPWQPQGSCDSIRYVVRRSTGRYMFHTDLVFAAYLYSGSSSERDQLRYYCCIRKKIMKRFLRQQQHRPSQVRFIIQCPHIVCAPTLERGTSALAVHCCYYASVRRMRCRAFALLPPVASRCNYFSQSQSGHLHVDLIQI